MSQLLAGINQQIQTQLEEINTAFFAKVIAVTGNTVAVEMLAQRIDTEGDTTDDVPVYNLPIYHPSTSASAVRFPVRAGDTVICVVMQSSLDNIKNQNTGRGGDILATRSSDYRRFDAMDAIAIPFNLRVLTDFDYTLPLSQDDMAIVHNIGSGQEAHIKIDGAGDVTVKSQFTVKVEAKDIKLEAGSSLEIKAQTMSINVPNTTWIGNYALTGEATFNGIPFSTHKHTGVTSGNQTSATPVP